MIIVFYKETINTSAIAYLLLQGEIHIDVAAMLKQKVMMVMMPPRGCVSHFAYHLVSSTLNLGCQTKACALKRR